MTKSYSRAGKRLSPKTKKAHQKRLMKRKRKLSGLAAFVYDDIRSQHTSFKPRTKK